MVARIRKLFEEAPNLRIPLGSVRLDERGPLVDGDLGHAHSFRAAATPQLPFTSGPQVLHPVGLTARRQEVSLTLVFEDVP